MMQERAGKATTGWGVLAGLVVILGFTLLALMQAAKWDSGFEAFLAMLGIATIILVAAGFFTLEPNQSATLVLFGDYRGIVKTSGFWWANPFMKKIKISLRARNLNGEKLKVNDKAGNPVEIAAIVVWRVKNVAQALFDVDSYEKFIHLQLEAATRHLASVYPYDSEDGQISLRGSMNEVSQALEKELQDRVQQAGLVIEEARLSHLAYAQEIAQTMLRRQQAEAVIAARQKIVHGAVSMVEMALKELADRKVLKLDDERKAAMVSNLLVVLCGESEAQPVVNTGTLYHG